MVISNWIRICAAALGLAAAAPSQAGLALTADGIALGFGISTFATVLPGYDGCCSGPFGVAMDTSGGSNTVIVSVNGLRYQFNDADGQTPATALNTVPSSSSTLAYATANGVAYGGDGSPVSRPARTSACGATPSTATSSRPATWG